MKKKFNLIKAIFTWHRRLGLVALALVIILSITGLMLNHTESFKLDTSFIQNSLLLNRYGLNPKGEPISFQTSSFRVTQWQQQLFVNNHVLLKHPESLQGVAQIEMAILLVFNNHLILLDKNGEIVEEIPSPLQDINAVGVLNYQFVIKNNQQLLQADDDVIDWYDIESDKVSWATQSALQYEQRLQLKKVFRGQGLTLERVILDLHSGRLFHDDWGIYIMDGAAIILMMLGLSGFWVWYQRHFKK